MSRWSRSLALVLVALALLAAPVAGHAVNYVSVDPQRTADGAVVVEAAYLEETGWVALYADGEPVGHARVDRALTTVTDVRVSVEDGAWRANDTLRVRPRLYADDGDGTFDPGEDRRLVLFGTQSGTTVARGDAAHVLAERATALDLADGVPVRSVALPADGYLVVERGGERLGSLALPAGIHANVTVPVDRERVPANGTQVSLVVLADDGDGELDADDRPVRAGGSVVRTVVELSGERETAAPVTTPSPSPSPSPSPTAGDGAGFGVLAALAALLLFARRR